MCILIQSIYYPLEILIYEILTLSELWINLRRYKSNKNLNTFKISKVEW